MKKSLILYFLVDVVWIVAYITAQNSSSIPLTYISSSVPTSTVAPLSANASPRNISRGKPTFQSATYGSRVASNAVNGYYDTSNADNCATAYYNPSSYYSYIASYNVWWSVDLGDLYAVFGVTMYNAATLPDVIFFRDLYVYVSPSNQTLMQLCGNTNGQDTTQSGVVTVNCNPFVYGRYVTICRDRNSNLNRNLTLCEVDVAGSKFILSPSNGKLSAGKPASQSSTYGSRTANLANDGIIDTTIADNCATPIAYHPYSTYYYGYPYSVFAWWQVDLQQLCVVTFIQIILPQSLPDSSFQQQFVITVNNVNNLTLATRAFQCQNYQPTNGNYYNATCPQYSFGQYVTIQQATYPYLALMTLCEVIVYGSTVQLESNDPTFSLLPTITTNDNAAENYSTYKALAIAAIVIASVTFLLLVVVVALLIKLMLKEARQSPHTNKPLPAPPAAAKNAGRRQHSASNDYDDGGVDDGPEEMYSDVAAPHSGQSDELEYTELPEISKKRPAGNAGRKKK